MAANKMSKKSGDQNQPHANKILDEVDLTKEAGGGLTMGERETIAARHDQFHRSAKRMDVMDGLAATVKRTTGR